MQKHIYVVLWLTCQDDKPMKLTSNWEVESYHALHWYIYISLVCVCVTLCVCVRERETWVQIKLVLSHSLCLSYSKLWIMNMMLVKHSNLISKSKTCKSKQFSKLLPVLLVIILTIKMIYDAHFQTSIVCSSFQCTPPLSSSIHHHHLLLLLFLLPLLLQGWMSQCLLVL